MKQRSSAICAYLAAVCTILILLVTSIDVICFDRDFFASEYKNMGTAEENHMSDADLMKATTALLAYLQDDRDDIAVEIEVYELPKQAFNERETAHMVDVKSLYQAVLKLRLGAIVVLIISLGVLFAQKKKEGWGLLATAYAQCALCFLCIVVMLGLWAMVDFTSLWESFHKMFFTNDLWLLNPRTDLMIRMFPEDFFFHMVLRIAGMFLAVFLTLWGLSLWKLKKEYPISLFRWKKKGEQI